MARVLIIAPHADDEVIGCGGMMAKRFDEDSISVVVVSLGSTRLDDPTPVKTRRDEMYKAHDLLGVKTTYVLGYNSGFLDQVPMYDLVQRLEEKMVGRDEVYIPVACHMHDHTVVNQACLAALRPGGVTPRVPFVAEYEHNWPGWSPTVGNAYCKLSDVEAEAKLSAMECYESQWRRHKDSPSHPVSLDAIMKMMATRGYECGCDYAERYKILFAML